MAAISLPAFLNPISQSKKFSGRYARLTPFLLIAFSEAGYYEFFTHIKINSSVTRFHNIPLFFHLFNAVPNADTSLL